MFSTALARDLKYISNETYLERLASVNTPAPNPWLLDQEGEIYKDSSIEGLAKILGVDDQRLARTLDDYNRAIGSNNLSALNIPRTHKPRPLRAPFYGLRVVPGITFTMGHPGEWTRPSSERRREAVHGLYAAGDSIGGLMGGYRGGYTGGLMQALATGILAGETASQSALENKEN